MKEKKLYFFIMLGILTGFIGVDRLSDFPVILMVSIPFIIYFIAYKILVANEVKILNFILILVGISSSLMFIFSFYDTFSIKKAKS